MLILMVAERFVYLRKSIVI